MAFVNRTKDSCPLCTSFAFTPTEQSFNLADVLARWQSEAGIKLRDSVWKEYTHPTGRQVTLYHCQECGFARFQPPISGSQEFYADVTAGEYYVHEKWEFFQAIKDLKRHKSRRLLDVGCGSGQFLELLGRNTRTIEYAGYEFSPEAAGSARSRGHTVYEGQFPEAVLQENETEPFDAVCVFQVIEHIVDPVRFVKAIAELLRPRGMLIVSVPNADGPLRFFSDALTDIPPHHVSRWCDSALRIGMPTLGFAVEKIAREPLPDYLWESYLPAMWESNIWPAVICNLLYNVRRMDKADRIRWFIQKMKSLRVRWLWGVPGHTLYAVLQLMEN